MTKIVNTNTNTNANANANATVGDVHGMYIGEVLNSIYYEDRNDVVGCIADGILIDTITPLPRDVAVIHTLHMDSIYSDIIIHHSAAHVMAAAIQKIHKQARLGYSQETDNSYYYDFLNLNSVELTTDDLEKVRLEMLSMISKNTPMTRKDVSIAEAMGIFHEREEPIKIKKITSLSEQGFKTVSMYYIGDDWCDLCAGPHLDNIGKIGKHFAIFGAMNLEKYDHHDTVRISGAVWRNESAMKTFLKDSNREGRQLTHQELNHDMCIFHMQQEAHGNPFWHENGMRLINALQRAVEESRKYSGFREISTPFIMDKSLWEASGHWDKYSENIFTVKALSKDKNKIQEELVLRPMNCPGAVQVFNAKHVSHNELPMRLSEHGKVFRNEHSGALKGISRTVSFTIDDGHIFCTKEQVGDEIRKTISNILSLYDRFGFVSKTYISTKPDVYVGDDTLWDEMTSHLKEALGDSPYIILPGEGAFYGPKIEFHVKDNTGRSWQCGTIQLDFNMPARLGAKYTGADNKYHTPILVHVASIGSYERFISIIMEHYNGHFPYWLAPVQLVIIPISNKSLEYAKKTYNTALTLGIRAELDCDNATISYKIQKYNKKRAFCACIVGPKEEQSETVSMRRLIGTTTVSCNASEMKNVLANL